MGYQPIKLVYSKPKRRFKPASRDLISSMFMVLAVLAGLMGLLFLFGTCWVVAEWLQPELFGSDLQASAWGFIGGIVYMIALFTLCFFAVRFARRPI